MEMPLPKLPEITFLGELAVTVSPGCKELKVAESIAVPVAGNGPVVTVPRSTGVLPAVPPLPKKKIVYEAFGTPVIV